MIEVQVIGDKEVVARLNAVPGNVHAGLARAIAKLGFMVEAKAKGYVSGPMLQVRTGVGRSSINTAFEDLGVGRGAQATTGIGRAAPYMAIQHEGVDHYWPISAHGKALRFKVGFGEYDVMAAILGGSRERAYGWIFRKRVIHPPLKAHPFLTTALRDIQPEIEPTISAEIATELAK